jgi:uncharacterized protein YciI
MSRRLLTCAASAALLLLFSCRTADADRSAEAPPPPSPRYVLTILKTGEAKGLSKERLQEVFAGHFSNMERLAREGVLLLAGPYGAKRRDPSHRGVFLLDAADVATARPFAETDPGFRAGVFALEHRVLETDAPLRLLSREALARHDAAKARGETPKPGDGARGYALLFADDFARARAFLAAHPATLLLGRLDDGRAFAILDAADAEAARALLSADAEAVIGPYGVDDWYATDLAATVLRKRS